MVSYPSAVDVIEANKIVLRVTLDKHPHKLLGFSKGIQHMIDEIEKEEARGLTYQAACFMKRIAVSHFFDGANHRTAFLVTLQFLTQNGANLKPEQAHAVDVFMNDIGSKDIEMVENWIGRYLVKR